MTGQDILPSIMETRHEALGPQKLDEVLQRRSKAAASHRNMELLQTAQRLAAIETLDIGKFLG